MRMVLLGPPAAGKGTQGRRLAIRFGGAHVDTGEQVAGRIADGLAARARERG